MVLRTTSYVRYYMENKTKTAGETALEISISNLRAHLVEILRDHVQVIDELIFIESDPRDAIRDIVGNIYNMVDSIVWRFDDWRQDAAEQTLTVAVAAARLEQLISKLPKNAEKNAPMQWVDDDGAHGVLLHTIGIVDEELPEPHGLLPWFEGNIRKLAWRLMSDAREVMRDTMVATTKYQREQLCGTLRQVVIDALLTADALLSDKKLVDSGGPSLRALMGFYDIDVDEEDVA